MGMVTGNSITQTFSYDASGNVVSVNYNGTEYYYLRNAQNDIVKIIDGAGATVVEYKYDSWGKVLSTTGSLASTLGANQPFRYRGYVYDTETGWYYLQSRYYDPSIGRFISADVYLSTGQGILGHNAFAYCANNPIVKKDSTGYAVETVFDIISICMSVVEVASNPADIWVWVGLLGDAVDLIPFVTGVGEAVRAVRIVETVDDVVDAARAGVELADTAHDADRAFDTYNNVRRSIAGTGLEAHHIIEKRFRKYIPGLGSAGEMASIALTKAEHSIFTKAWRELLPYGGIYTVDDVLGAARTVYKDRPELLKYCERILTALK